MSHSGAEPVDLERELLELFRRQLRRAVDDRDEVELSDLDSIRTQKLVLIGLREFELEDRVTIQWYLDGDMLPHLPDSEEDVAIITNAGVENGPFPDPEEVYRFYCGEADESISADQTERGIDSSIPTGETLPEVLDRDAFEWLKDYYNSKEIPFSQVYETNLEIYLRLRHLEQYLDPDHERDELSGNTTPSQVAGEVSDSITRMKESLIEYPLFQSIPPYVTEFGRVSEQVLEQINEAVSSDEDTAPYRDLVSHLGRFYYKAIWQPIADRMGYYTVSAPSEDKSTDVREYRTESLQSARNTFITELNSLRERASDLDIRFEARTERLPQFKPEKSGLEDVLSLNIDNITSSAG